MEITVILCDVLDSSSEIRTITVSDDTSLAEFLTELGFPAAELDLNSYYPVFDAYSANAQVLPFVISRGVARWGVFYRDATVNDVASTLQINGRPLRLNVGIPQAGGPDIHDLLTLWRYFYSAVQAVDPIVGVGGGVAGMWVFLRRVLRRRHPDGPPLSLRQVSPGAVFSLILLREAWNPTELSQLAGMTREDAVNLLRLCQYKWDRHAQHYSRTADTSRVMERLNQVQQYEHL